MSNISDNSVMLIALAAAIPIYYIVKPLFFKSPVPHVKGGNLLTGHTDEIFNNAVEFMKDCRKDYGSLYSIRYLGKEVVVFGKEWVDELFKNKDLEFDDAFNEAFLVNEVMGNAEYMHDPKVHNPRIIRSMITPFLNSYKNRIFEQINSVDKELFEGKKSVVVKLPVEIIRRMVVKASCNIMLGSNFSEDEEIIEVFYNYPVNVELSTFSKFQYIKYPIIGRLYARYLINKEKVHLPYLKLFTEKVAKEVGFRKDQEKLESYEKSNDVLQRLIDDNFSIEEISIACLGLIFASVMTTTNNAAFSLYDMMTYPQYLNELYEEQLQVQKEFGNELSLENLNKMSKLNSFIRESMRLRVDGITNFRFTTTNWTLSNGITLPKGTFLAVDSFSLHYDKELQEGSPYEFTPFRHAANGKLATKVEPQNISFGLGKHACPGRFLAIQEIMTILSFLLRNYKINTIDGKPHPYKVNSILFDLPKGEPLIFTKLNGE